MKPFPERPGWRCLAAAAATGLLAASALAGGADHGDTSVLDGSGDYRRELQACRAGRTAEDRATCLKEARHAQAERRRGTLGTPGDLQANALARCQVHRDDLERRACRDRVLDPGRLSGSVAGGGLLREQVVTLPADEAGATGAMGAGPRSPAAGPAPQTAPQRRPAPEAPAAPEVPEAMDEPPAASPLEPTPDMPAYPQE